MVLRMPKVCFYLYNDESIFTQRRGNTNFWERSFWCRGVSRTIFWTHGNIRHKTFWMRGDKRRNAFRTLALLSQKSARKFKDYEPFQGEGYDKNEGVRFSCFTKKITCQLKKISLEIFSKISIVSLMIYLSKIIWK